MTRVGADYKVRAKSQEAHRKRKAINLQIWLSTYLQPFLSRRRSSKMASAVMDNPNNASNSQGKAPLEDTLSMEIETHSSEQPDDVLELTVLHHGDPHKFTL